MLARARLFFLSLLEDIDHVFDRGDPRNRFLCKRERVSHGSDELAVDVHGAAAHSREDTGSVHERTAQSGNDNTLFRVGHSVESAENFYFKPLGFRTLEYGH